MPLLHSVMSSLGGGAGQLARVPSHEDSYVQLSSFRQRRFSYSATKKQRRSQHGPSLGLWGDRASVKALSGYTRQRSFDGVICSTDGVTK